MTPGICLAVAALVLYATACSVWSIVICLHLQDQEREQ